MTFLSLKNSPISSNHQNVHQNWWKFNRKFKSPKHSPKLVKILAKIHWKMNVVSYLWDHIDFLQNCHQFWWFSSIFANFCDFFIEIYSDSLKFSPKLVTKKNQNQKKLFSPEMVIFLSLKNSPISSNHQNFHQNWWQKKNKIGRNYCHQNWWHFRHSKTHQFLQFTKHFTKIGEKLGENSIENSNHQNIHKNWWKFWRKFTRKWMWAPTSSLPFLSCI